MNRNAIKKELQRVKKKEKKFLYRASSNEGSYIQSVVNRIIPKKLSSKLNLWQGFQPDLQQGTHGYQKNLQRKTHEKDL